MTTTLPEDLHDKTVVAPKIHIAFLDSIRGLAALYVLGFHIKWIIFILLAYDPHPMWTRLASLFHFGHLAVDVFIVLSGFCLMIPISRAGGQLNRGITDFFRRRSRRILPPYYACLVYTAVITLLDIEVQKRGGLFHPFSSRYYVEWTVVHLLLLQNVFPKYLVTFNTSLWSVATEWQIYFAFAFVLLPMFRKWGAIATVMFGYLVGLATLPFFFQDACLWYLGLFAMGMTSADFCFSRKPKPYVTPTMLLSIAAACAVLCLPASYAPAATYGENPFVDFLFGISCSCLLAHFTLLAMKPAGQKESYILKFLSSRPLVSVGRFSYSLYLVHIPLLELLRDYLVGCTRISDNSKCLLMYGIGFPVSLVVGYVFHVFFERPFMNSLQKPITKASAISAEGNQGNRI